MSGTNASIPLAYNPQALGPDLGQAIQVGNQFANFQANAQELRGQNAMRALFADPSNLDASGMPNANAMRQIMAVDPDAGMKLMANKQALYNQQLGAKMAALNIGDKQQNMLRGVNSDAMLAYDRAVKEGKSPEQARAAAQDVYTEGYDGLTQSGAFSPDQIAHLSPQFDPDRARLSKGYWDAQKAGFTQQLDLEKLRLAEHKSVREKYTAPATYVGTDAEGKPVQVEAQQDKDTGKWVTASGDHAPVDISRLHKAAPTELSGNVVSDDAARLIAQSWWKGDKSAAQGYGRSPANQTKIANAIAEMGKEMGKDGADRARAVAEYQGAISAERTLGTRAANMEIAANEVRYMAPLALSASDKVSRTQYPALNDILIAAEKGTGDENVVRFGLAANSLIYTYSKFLNPTGIPTDADKAKATEILSTAWSKGQFKTAIDQIEQEIKSGQQGVARTKEEVGAGISGKSDNEPPGANPPKSQLTPAQAEPLPPDRQAGGVYKDVTAAEYGVLPKGAHYTKPGSDKVFVKQ